MKITTKATLNLKGFEQLRKGLQRGQYVEVGLFGSHKNERTDGDGLTNVELGIIQEFGSISNNIPARSFIRMPLQEKRKEILAFMAKPKMAELLKTGRQKKALALLGEFAAKIIDDAFATSGFGKWAPNKPSTIKAKGSDKPLIDTQQLRQSIWSKVKGA